MNLNCTTCMHLKKIALNLTSAGFITIVQPAAKAAEAFLAIIENGKFHLN